MGQAKWILHKVQVSQGAPLGNMLETQEIPLNNRKLVNPQMVGILLFRIITISN